MSPFIKRHLRVSLEPGRLSLATVRPGRRLIVEHEHSQEAAIDAQAPTLTDFRQLLANQKHRNLPLQCVVSDLWAKYFSVELLPGIRTIRDLNQLTIMRFEHLFGLDPVDWVIKADWRASANSCLACALPKPLCDAILDIGKSYGHREIFIRPFFIAEFNRRCHTLDKNRACFVVTDHHCLTLGIVEKSEWMGVRQHLAELSSNESLERIIRRNVLLFCASDETLPIVLTGRSPNWQTMSSGPLAPNVLSTPQWRDKPIEWADHFRLALADYWP